MRDVDFAKNPLTLANSLRLCGIAGPGEGCQSAAARELQPAPAAARTEPTVTTPSFDAVEQHVGSVYRYALRLAGRTDLAEDLAQETLLRGWRNRDKLRDVRVARLWLLRIATNVWMDHLRKSRFGAQRLEREPPCPRPTAAAVSNERENVERALAAMDELPPRQRQVLYLSTCEGLSHAEVAEILAISLSAVKANLSLARQEMRRRLSDVYEQVCGRRTCRESS
jgi:RNA polymerase sigma-70 factor (ECF subfamily)